MLHRLAPLVFGGVSGSDEGGALGIRQPHFEELVVEPAPAAGSRLLGRLGPADGLSLREHPGRRNLPLRESRPACRIVLLPRRCLREAFVGHGGGRAPGSCTLEVVLHARVWLRRRQGLLLLHGERPPPVARLAAGRVTPPSRGSAMGGRLFLHATFDLDVVAVWREGASSFTRRPILTPRFHEGGR